MIPEISALFGLFAVAFGAATILPFQSEVVFVALQVAEKISPFWLVVVASIGNTLGSVANYAMGRSANRLRGSRWFAVSDAQMARAQRFYQRWGLWTLLLSWAPLGDAVTMIAGIMRTPLWLFVTLVAIAKTGRYIVLAWLTTAATG